MAIRKHLKIILPLAVVIVLAFLAVPYYLKARSEGKNPTQKANPIVSIAFTKVLDLPIVFSAQGHLVALNQVEVRPQINAVVRTVEFHEGDAVKAGQLLFTLDASDLTAQLNRYQAQSAQITALLGDARRDCKWTPWEWSSACQSNHFNRFWRPALWGRLLPSWRVSTIKTSKAS